MLVLGLDPARQGAALLTLRGRAVAAMSWRPRVRSGRKVYAATWATCVGPGLPGPTTTKQGITTAWELGIHLRACLSPLVLIYGGGRCLVVSEGQHVGRNAQSALNVARFAGALAGPVESWDPDGITWVEPDEWRKESFRPKWWTVQAAAVGMVASMASANKRVLMEWDPAANEDVRGDRAAIDRRQAAAAKALFLPKRDAAKAEARLAMPGLVPGLQELAAAVSDGVDADDVYDAAGVCRWRQNKG